MARPSAARRDAPRGDSSGPHQQRALQPRRGGPAEGGRLGCRGQRVTHRAPKRPRLGSHEARSSRRAGRG
jgi:hypothetical protein